MLWRENLLVRGAHLRSTESFGARDWITATKTVVDYGLFLALLLFCFVHADDARPIMQLARGAVPIVLIWRHLFIAGVMFYEAVRIMDKRLKRRKTSLSCFLSNPISAREDGKMQIMP
jgi:hypothetical protein